MKGLIAVFVLGTASWLLFFYTADRHSKTEAKADPVTVHITNTSPFEIIIWIPTDLTGTNTSHTVPVLIGPGYQSTVRYSKERYRPEVEMTKSK